MAKNIDRKPKRAETTCSICKSKAVELYVDDFHIGRSSVQWCEYGHVVIVQPNNFTQCIYNFSEYDKDIKFSGEFNR